MVPATCPQCGGTFETYPYRLKRAKPPLCSRECRHAQDRANRPPRPEPTPRQKIARQSDTHPDKITCAADGCSKLLSRAAVAGESVHCSRECAGFGVPDGRLADEPTDRQLAEVAAH